MRNRLQRIVTFDIQVYRRPQDLRVLRETHVPFSGSLYKHPRDPEKVILVVDPHRGHKCYYEFRTDDISFVEKLPSIVSPDGKTFDMARLWVKKRSIGIKCTPFAVNNIKISSN